MGKLNTFYGKKGEKGMSLLVFFVFFVLGSALGMFMQTASLEEEFTGAAAAAVCSRIFARTRSRRAISVAAT